MRQLFISYARGTKPGVESLVYALGYRTRSILPFGGQTWWEEGPAAHRRLRSVVAMVSGYTLNSVACRRELEWELALNKPVLSLAGERLPDALPSALAMRCQIIAYSQYPSRRSCARFGEADRG